MKTIIVLALAGLFAVSVAGADTTTRTVPVFEATGGPFSTPPFPVGSKVDGASATIIRNEGGVAVIIETEDLPEGGAYTAWWFECLPPTTTEDCIPALPPPFGSSDTTGDDDEVHLAFGISEGFGISDSASPFVVLILDHGRVDPELIDEQLSKPGLPMTPGAGTPTQVVKFDLGGGDDDDDDDSDSDSDSDSD